MPSRKYIEDALRAFQVGEVYSHKSCSVRFLPIPGSLGQSEDVGLYSYELLIGRRVNGAITLLPIPGKDASISQGGSKTSRTLINAAHQKFPGAYVPKSWDLLVNGR